MSYKLGLFISKIELNPDSELSRALPALVEASAINTPAAAAAVVQKR